MRNYYPTKHAIEQAQERLGKDAEQAKNHLVQLMQTAAFQGIGSRGARIYDHYKSRTRLVLAEKTDTIITVYPMDTDKGDAPVERVPIDSEMTSIPSIPEATETKPKLSQDNVFISAFQAIIKRELTKARRNYVREYRKLTEEIAVIGLEIAQLNLNKARAKSPVTQGHITDKVSEIHAIQTELAEQRKQLEAQFRAMKSEVGGLVDV